MWNLWDFLFPPTCLHCGREVMHMGDWCQTCLDRLFHCQVIEDSDSSYLDMIITLGAYQEGLKRMFHDVKFNQQKERARGAAPFLRRFSEHVLFKELRPHFVIPVPTSNKNLQLRGYNQVDLFFKDWIEEQHAQYPTYWKWIDLTVKLDHSKAMWGLTKKERKENLKNMFIVKKMYRDNNILEGKDILLVDDIYTTGATINELCRILRPLHPHSIKALTIAGGV